MASVSSVRHLFLEDGETWSLNNEIYVFCQKIFFMTGNPLYLVVKSECRISKSETNPNDKKPKYKTI